MRVLFQRLETVQPMSAFAIFSNLSLFKQVTHEELVSLIPRIALDFSTFMSGDQVLDPEKEQIGLMYLLEGRVLGRYKDSRVQFGPGDLLTFSGLFGRNKQAFMSLEALEPAKVLTLDAHSLTFLMQQHQAILTTYVGWLSDAADPIRCLHTLNELRQPSDSRP